MFADCGKDFLEMLNSRWDEKRRKNKASPGDRSIEINRAKIAMMKPTGDLLVNELDVRYGKSPS